MKKAIEKAVSLGFDLKKQLFPYAVSYVRILSWFWVEYETSASSKRSWRM
jgi:hypothetical protein